MKGTMLYGPGDVRFEERPDPKIIEPTDAILQSVGSLRVRVRLVALSRHRADQRTGPHGA